MRKKVHILTVLGLCAFLVCSCTPKNKTNNLCQHYYSIVAAKEPSFYEDGNCKHYVCNKCKKYFDLNKNEISYEDTIRRIELFDKLDKNEPQMMFGKDISLTYKAEDTQNIISEGNNLIIKINNKNYSAIEANEFIKKLNNHLDFTLGEYYKSSVLADSYARENDYETKNKIYNDYYDLGDLYWAVYVAIAKEGSNNDKFFKGKTQQEIDDFIKQHSPSTGQGSGQSGPSTNRKMESLINDYAAGKIDRYSTFSQFVTLANTLAKEKSYPSYLEYAYKQNGRDYTKEDSVTFSNYTLQYITPLASQIKSKVDIATKDSQIVKGINKLQNDFFGKYMGILRDYALNLGGSYKTNFQNMFEEGDYFFSNIESATAGAYTSSGGSLGEFIFLGKNYQNIKSLIHEFGHYNSFICFGNVTSLDLAETQSRGNEYLFLSYLKETSMDKNLVKAYIYERLFYLINTILLACAINEIEMFAYTNEFTQEILEQKWVELMDKYGAITNRNKFDYLYEVLIRYNVYYISYAVSGVAILELFQKTYNNFEKAKTMYESICTKDSSDEKFLKSLENAELSNVFSKEAFESIALLNNI